MKKLIAILLLMTAITSYGAVEEYAIAVSSDRFVASQTKIINALGYIMFRSDYQSDYMRNGVLSQFNWGSHVAKSDGVTPVYVWRYSILKAQKLSAEDQAYIVNLLNDSKIKVYRGSKVNEWLSEFANRTSEEVTNVAPVVIGEYDDTKMQSGSNIEFATFCLPNVWNTKKQTIIDYWLDISGLQNTPANRLKIEGRLNTTEYCKISDDSPVYVLQANIKKLKNESLTKRDAFRVAVDEPTKAWIGFMRQGQEIEILGNYGFARKVITEE